MKMKESTFCLLFAIALVVIGYFDGGARGAIGFIMAYGFLLVSSICRAIERNGKEC